MGPEKRIFQKFQAASSKYRFLKDNFDPFTNAGKLESFEGKNKKVWQELYKEDVESLILFLQQNMPND